MRSLLGVEYGPRPKALPPWSDFCDEKSSVECSKLINGDF
jgi:hypothetical protein